MQVLIGDAEPEMACAGDVEMNVNTIANTLEVDIVDIEF